MNKEKIVGYVLEQMQETSTLRGIIGAVVTLVGISVAPERMDAIALLVAGLSAFLKVVLPDRLGGDSDKPAN